MRSEDWIKVDEVHPFESCTDEVFLVWVEYPDGDSDMAWCSTDGIDFFFDDPETGGLKGILDYEREGYKVVVTHWQPLPGRPTT